MQTSPKSFHVLLRQALKARKAAAQRLELVTSPAESAQAARELAQAQAMIQSINEDPRYWLNYLNSSASTAEHSGMRSLAIKLIEKLKMY